MNRKKKFLSLILSAVLLLTMAMPVMATEYQQSAGEYSISVRDRFKGHVYEAYQIFAGDYDDATKVLTNIKWGTGFDSSKEKVFLLALKTNEKFKGTDATNLFSSITENDSNIAAEIAKIVATWGPDSTYLQEFAKVLHTSTVDINEDGTKEINYTYLITEPLKPNVSVCTSEVTEGEITYHTYKISGLKCGYYLVKDQDGTLNEKNDYYTRLLLHLVELDSNNPNLVISPKGGVPEVTKTVSTNLDKDYVEGVDASTADTIYFKLEGTLPSNYLDYTEYTYKFVDTLPEGLVLNYTDSKPWEVIKEAYILHSNNSESKLNIAESSDNEATSIDLIINQDIKVTHEENKITISFTDLRKSIPKLVSGDKIIIKYATNFSKEDIIVGTGTQKDNDISIENNEVESGDYGNENKVYLEFSNNPQGEGLGKTPEDDAKVYTFRLAIDKKSDTGVKLANAEFLLYQRILKVNKTDAYDYYYAKLEKTDDEVNNYRVIEWVKVEEQIVGESKDLTDYSAGETNYALNAKGEQMSNIDLEDFIITTQADETTPVSVEGLDGTTYWLHELNSPLGYNKLEEDLQINFQSTIDKAGVLTSLIVKVDNADGTSYLEGGTGIVPVINKTGTTLPSTGGTGRTLLYAGGAIFATVAVVFLVTKKRMKSEK